MEAFLDRLNEWNYHLGQIVSGQLQSGSLTAVSGLGRGSPAMRFVSAMSISQRAGEHVAGVVEIIAGGDDAGEIENLGVDAAFDELVHGFAGKHR